MRNLHLGVGCHSAFRIRHFALFLLFVTAPSLSSAQQLPPLPDIDGRGVHVLALAADARGTVWAGTYGQGIYVLPAGAAAWERVTAISSDFVNAFAFGARGEIWYGTIGNGWGVSTDSGKTWTNWELGADRRRQYVAPNGIVTRGDTVYVATLDGIKRSSDRGTTWAVISDRYVLALAVGPDGSLWAGHLRGIARSRDGGRSWAEYPSPVRCAKPECANRVRALAIAGDGSAWVGTEQGLYRFDPARGSWIDGRGRTTCGAGPVVKGCRVSMPPIAALARGPTGDVYAATASGVYGTDGDALNSCDAGPFATALLPLAGGRYAVGRTDGLASCRFDQGSTLVSVTYRQRPDTETSGLRHSWYARPIALDDQPYVNHTDRHLSPFAGDIQQEQGIEFNTADSTVVHAIGDGVVVFAGPTIVAIRHDRRTKARDGERFLFSVYSPVKALRVSLGQRVSTGDTIAQVGSQLHLEIHSSPVDSLPLREHPDAVGRYTVNPELWIAPLPGTGVVAGQVWDGDGKAVPEARVYGLLKAEPQETPFSYVETYGGHEHSDPVYDEHFAVSDVPPGDYTLTVDVNGRRLTRRVRVQEHALTWVVFRRDAH